MVFIESIPVDIFPLLCALYFLGVHSGLIFYKLTTKTQCFTQRSQGFIKQPTGVEFFEINENIFIQNLYFFQLIFLNL